MFVRLSALFGIVLAAVLATSSAQALTMKECSAKYKSAKDNGTVGTMNWNEFRKAECASDASATETAAPDKKKKAPTAQDDKAVGLSMKDCSAKYQAAKKDGTLNGLNWNDFRKTECSAAGDGAKSPVAEKTIAKPAKTTAKTSDTTSGLSMHDCSVKYQEAKSGGTLGGMKWNDFRKAKCAADAADDETVPAPNEAKFDREPDPPSTTAPKGAKFPASLSAKYSRETAGKARMHTCLDQYYADKEANSLGGLKWIQKGGGFYSLCNAKLKG